MSTFDKLMRNFTQDGRVDWIGVRAKRGQAVEVLEEVFAEVDKGLRGDRAGARPGGKRQVTLLQAEYLPIVASWLNVDELPAEILRRNIVVSGVNLNALKDQRVRVGEAVIQITGYCHPCKKMEQVLGFGAFNLLRGHGGLTAKVLESGMIRLNDPVSPLLEYQQDSLL